MKKAHESRSVVFVENSFGNRIQRSNENKIEKIDSSTSTEDFEVPEIVHDDDEEDPDTAEEESLHNIELPRRSTRPRKIPDRGPVITGDWWNCKDSLNAELEETLEAPKNIDEALSSPLKEQWQIALNDKYSSLMKNKAWTLLDLPKDRSTVGSRWRFKIEYKSDGTIERSAIERSSPA